MSYRIQAITALRYSETSNQLLNMITDKSPFTGLFLFNYNYPDEHYLLFNVRKSVNPMVKGRCSITFNLKCLREIFTDLLALMEVVSRQ